LTGYIFTSAIFVVSSYFISHLHNKAAKGVTLGTDPILYQDILYFHISLYFTVHASCNFIYDHNESSSFLSRYSQNSQILRQHYVHISGTGPHQNLKIYLESTDRTTFTPESEEMLLLLRL